MEQGTKELINILRAFLEERPLSREEIQNAEIVLADVLHLAKINNVLGILAYKIYEYYEQNGVADNEEKLTAETAYKIYYRTASLIEKRVKAFEELSEKLCKEKLDHLIFKGIKVKDLYPIPYLRTFGDIDFIIHPNDRERCHALMQELGYDTVINLEPVYTYKRDHELYEIHCSIMTINFTNRANYIDYFSSMWDYAVPVTEHLWEFSAEYHFIYLLSHIAKHVYGSGAGIRMYLDLALYINRLGETMNWDLIQDEIKKLKLERFFSLVLTSIYHWFGISAPVYALNFDEGFLDSFEKFTLTRGTFGFVGFNVGQEAVRKQAAISKKNVRLNALKRFFFPSSNVMKTKYTYIKKYPWLLPIAWIDRFIRNYKRIGFKLETADEIIKTSDKTIKEKKDFYNEMGL